MTDGLVKHEGVVSINDVPPYPSTSTDSNMCTFLSVTLCAYHTHTHTHTHKNTSACTHTLPLTAPVQYMRTDTHTDQEVCTVRCSKHTFTSPAHSYYTAALGSSLAASILLLMWENTALRNKSCPTEHEGIEFCTCCVFLRFQQWGTIVHLYSTGPLVKINFVQVVCGFSPSLNFFFFFFFSCVLYITVSSFFVVAQNHNFVIHVHHTKCLSFEYDICLLIGRSFMVDDTCSQLRWSDSGLQQWFKKNCQNMLKHVHINSLN